MLYAAGIVRIRALRQIFGRYYVYPIGLFLESKRAEMMPLEPFLHHADKVEHSGLAIGFKVHNLWPSYPKAAFMQTVHKQNKNSTWLSLSSYKRFLCLRAALAHLCTADQDEQDRPNDIEGGPCQDIEIRQESRHADEDERPWHNFVVEAGLWLVVFVHVYFWIKVKL
jgi:hypothetical protein